MSKLSIPNDIVDGTLIEASEHQQNYQQIESFVNDEVIHADGSVAMDAGAELLLGKDASVPLGAVTKAQLDNALGSDVAGGGFLPLAGGTLTGDLEVYNLLTLAGGDEIARISTQPGAGRQILSMFTSGGSDIYDSPYISMYGKNDSNASNKGSILIYTSGDERIRVNNDGLQVDGKVQSSGGSETAPGVSLSGTKSGLWGGDAGIAIVVNQKQKLDCKPDRVVSRENFAAEKDAEVGGVLRANQNLTVPNGAVRLEGTVNGTRDVPTAPNFHVNASGWTFRSTWTPSRMAFAPSKLARNNDVLERAETATLPPDIETDDDGNQTNTAEVEGHDTVELFDVVTALLAKVKQLSGRIEALEGQKGL